jgi:hypothetical protein
MARPKRMGAYNALDDLLPGPAWGAPADQGSPWDLSAGPAAEPSPPPRRPRLQPVPDPPRSRQGRGPNALDEVLPGPQGPDGLDDLLPGPPGPPGRRLGAAPRGRGDRGRRHLGVWNPLDGPPGPAAPEPVPPPAPARARVSFRLPADLVETARDAVAHLAGTADQTTLTALTERALRVELARLAITHNHGNPFPPRDP